MTEVPDHNYSVQHWLKQIMESIEKLTDVILVKCNYLDSSLKEIVSAVMKK
jgi:hypothetical protein